MNRVICLAALALVAPGTSSLALLILISGLLADPAPAPAFGRSEQQVIPTDLADEAGTLANIYLPDGYELCRVESNRPGSEHAGR